MARNPYNVDITGGGAFDRQTTGRNVYDDWGKSVAKQAKKEQDEEKRRKRVDAYREGFFKIVGQENQKRVLDSLKKRAKKDPLAREQYNAIAGDERIKQPALQAEDIVRPLSKTERVGGVVRDIGRGIIAAPEYFIESAIVNPGREIAAQVTGNERALREAQRRSNIDLGLGEEGTDIGGAAKRFAGRTAELASLGVGGGSLTQIARAGGRRAVGREVAKTAASGAVAGAGAILGEDPDATARELVEGAVIGAGTGVAASAAAAGVGAAGRAIRNSRKVATNAILDETRLIPARATAAAQEITDEARLLTPGQVDPTLAVRVPSANAEVLKRLNDVEERISKAQQTGKITPTEARSLMQERTSLLENIRTGRSPELRRTGEAIQEVMKNHQVRLKTQTNGGRFVPRVALRSEARAVADKLAPDGFDLQPTAVRLHLDEQANLASDLVDADYELAKRIAMGAEPSPEGLQASAVYKAVESRAAKEADVDLINALATESTIPAQATQAGQFNAALAAFDPESPIDIIRDLNKVRAKSKIKSIPKVVTPEEAQRITTLAQDVNIKRAKAIENIDDKATRLDYGIARVQLDNYVNSLKEPALKRTARQVVQEEGIPRAGLRLVSNTAGSLKGLTASLDDSFLGRQGIKTLWTSPKTWLRNSIKSFGDLYKGFGSDAVNDALKADIISRPNNLNGLYKKMGLDVIDVTEEAFPVNLPEKIPGLGRAFRASDAAYTGFAQRARADLADKYIQIAQKTGVDLTNKREAESIGNLVNALTGRGKLKSSKKSLNNVFFSPHLMKSNWDVLTGHTFQKDVTPFVRRQAAFNLLRIAGGTAGVLALANVIRPGSVEWDPRSSDFGKIRIGNIRYDVTGGMGGMVTLASRLFGVKSTTTGDVKTLWDDGYTSQDGLDVVYNFFENKTSPAASVVRDLLRGETFDGSPVSAKSILENTVIPLSLTNFGELQENSEGANKIIGVITEALGISTNAYSAQEDWRNKTSRELEDFRLAAGEQKFLEANDKFNQEYVTWLDRVKKDDRYKKSDNETRATTRDKKKAELRKKILKDYGFTYKRQQRTDEAKALIEGLSGL